LQSGNVAKPRQEHSAANDTAARRMAVAARATAVPRAVNDNHSSFSRGLYRFIPSLIAAALFCWALWRVFVAH
jgi:hypothetical protein